MSDHSLVKFLDTLIGQGFNGFGVFLVGLRRFLVSQHSIGTVILSIMHDDVMNKFGGLFPRSAFSDDFGSFWAGAGD